MKLLEVRIFSLFSPEVFLSTRKSAWQTVDARHMLSGDCVNEDSSTCSHSHYFTLSCLCLFTLVLCLSLSPTLFQREMEPRLLQLAVQIYIPIGIHPAEGMQQLSGSCLPGSDSLPLSISSSFPQRYSKALPGGLSTGDSLWTKLTWSLSSGSLLVKLCIRPVFWQKSRGCYRSIQKGDPSYSLGSHLNLKMRPKECWLGSEKKGTIMNCCGDANWCSCCGKQYGASSRN